MKYNFGDLLKYYRERKAISQRSLAKLASINTSYISRLEKGARESTSRELALKLSKILDLSDEETEHWLLTAGYASDRLIHIPYSKISNLFENYENERDQDFIS